LCVFGNCRERPPWRSVSDGRFSILLGSPPTRRLS